MRISEKEFNKLIERNPHLLKTFKPISKPAKYRNVKMYEYADGLVVPERNITGHGNIVSVYDSEKEYYRWEELKLMQRSKLISDLERQKTIIIQEGFIYKTINGAEKIMPISYRADFFYIKGGTTVVEDVKPYDDKAGKYRLTQDFKLKWKLMKYRYPDYHFVIY